jgi:hypothetical protein
VEGGSQPPFIFSGVARSVSKPYRGEVNFEKNCWGRRLRSMSASGTKTK